MPWREFALAMPETFYFISDLHLGGDGLLAENEFMPELLGFLEQVRAGPRPAELIVVGDMFGLWELTVVSGLQKLDWLVARYPELFEKLRQLGAEVRITLIPGNHDYELACDPEFVPRLLAFNVHLEPVVHITRQIAGRRLWVEHGNQYDDFNRFPAFGDPNAMPLGFFATRAGVAASGRTAARARTQWVADLESVYPNEDIPLWMISQYFYREMAPLLRWAIAPFALLFNVSMGLALWRLLEHHEILPTHLVSRPWGSVLGSLVDIVDIVLAIDLVVLLALLVLAVPLVLFLVGLRRALKRFGIATPDRFTQHKDDAFVSAADRIFANHPDVALFIYGHTHRASMLQRGERYIINTGTWLKRLVRIAPRLRLMPSIFSPSYHLNYFEVSEVRGAIRIRYHLIPKTSASELTWLERALIVGRNRNDLKPVPRETWVPAGDAASP